MVGLAISPYLCRQIERLPDAVLVVEEILEKRLGNVGALGILANVQAGKVDERAVLQG